MNHTLRIEDAASVKPKKLQGDLYLGPDWIAYVAYRRGEVSYLGLLFLTLIWYIVRAQKMENWRDSLKGKPVEQMVEECPGSWFLPIGDVVRIESKFLAVLLITTSGGVVYRLDVPRYREFLGHAEKHGWPVAR